MEYLSKTSKAGQWYTDRYNKSTITDLYEAYDRPSYTKKEICENCRLICRQEGGKNFKLFGCYCNMFSVGFETKEGLRIITKYRNILIR